MQRHKQRQMQLEKTKRSPIVLFLLLLAWSIAIGCGLAILADSSTSQAEQITSNKFLVLSSTTTGLKDKFAAEEIFSLNQPLTNNSLTQNSLRETHSELRVKKNSKSTVDFVPERYQLGQELYLENCTSCHIGIPPAVLPTQTWRDILQDSQHYGTRLTPLVDPSRLLVWNYIQVYSRPLAENEQTPYRVEQSRYFKALHPQVKLTRPVAIANCVSCHPGAGEYDFRRLSSEWQNAP